LDLEIMLRQLFEPVALDMSADINRDNRVSVADLTALVALMRSNP
jgi:hypothetical protein